MFLPIPLVVLLAAPAPAQEPAKGPTAAAVAPVVGEEVAVIVRLDLAKWDVQASLRQIFGELADEEDIVGATQAVGDLANALKKAGARDCFVLFDLTEIPGLPVAVVPLTGEADGRAIAQALSGGVANSPLRWPVAETIRGAVVAGTPRAVAQVRDADPAARPELDAALATGIDAPIQVVIAPSATQRRAIEESIPTLPPQIGGGPITTLTRGLRWASFALTFGPKPALRVIGQAKDADAARTLQRIVQGAMSPLKPQVEGDRITIESDLATGTGPLVAAIRQGREAARRSQCVNNLKELGLGLHNYHSAHETFPAAYSTSRDGRPLLSWRVHILPFIEQRELYDQFHLDEPWDSPHNKALIPRMPKRYACPGAKRSLAAEGKTCYLTPRGAATIAPGASGIKIQEITDGTSNTIALVEANDDAAVIWTKPDDWEVGPEFTTRRLFGHHPGGMNVLFADGSVRFLKETIAPKLLQTLTTRNGGEVIREDGF